MKNKFLLTKIVIFAASLFSLIACTPEATTGTTTDTSSSKTQNLTINIQGGGSVVNLANNINCETSACTYSLQNGTNLTLMASAETNYAFDHWELSCDGQTSNECLINMNNNVTLTAVFALQSGTVSLSWLAPTAREDGSDLSESEIKEYVIYYRSNPTTPYEGASSFTIEADDTGAVPTELTIENLDSGKTYYFAGVTIDKNGATSRLSDEVMKTIN